MGLLFYYYLDLLLLDLYSKERFWEFLKNLFLWELVFFLSVSYIFYRLFRNYLAQKKEFQEVFTILLQAISHRFGNFLSIQKLNMELLRSCAEGKILTRLEESLHAMEEDYRQIISVLENFSQKRLEAQRVNFRDIFLEVFRRYDVNGGKLRISFSLSEEIFIEVPSVLMQTILSLLLENCFKYAKSRIYVRLGSFNKKAYLYISNDIRENITKGSGMGLKIAWLLSKKMGWTLKIKEGPFYAISLYTSLRS